MEMAVVVDKNSTETVKVGIVSGSVVPEGGETVKRFPELQKLLEKHKENGVICVMFVETGLMSNESLIGKGVEQITLSLGLLFETKTLIDKEIEKTGLMSEDDLINQMLAGMKKHLVKDSTVYTTKGDRVIVVESSMSGRTLGQFAGNEIKVRKIIRKIKDIGVRVDWKERVPGVRHGEL